MKMLFIVGLQKSGTTLLNRLLIEQKDHFFSPFNPEGKAFWGDDPPFSPQNKPCGELYQYHQGKKGHMLDVNDYQKNDQELLLDRIEKVEWVAPILLNKNPYNSVRIGWLKAMFPECKIVAMVRNPYANVYSLLKKHIPHEGRGMGPEEGWWGIKTSNWKSMISENKIKQLALQWKEVNQVLLSCKSDIDMFVDYKNLCRNPELTLKIISNMFDVEFLDNQNHQLACLDNEYLIGSSLKSKNKTYRETKSFEIEDTLRKTIELNPLKLSEKFTVARHTYFTYRKLKRMTGHMTQF